MDQFNLYVHGVPIGHEVCPRDAEEDYLKDFYSHDKEIKETSYMQIDILNGKSFYTYLHKKNVSSNIGRPGSYLGLTVCFSKQYCTNVYMLYEILETIYQKICIGCLVKQESGGEHFLVKEIASAQFKGNLAVDYIKAAFKQNMEKYLSNEFKDLDGFSNSVGEAKFSLKEVDSPLFKDTLKDRRILVSPEYGTFSVAYNNLLKKVVPLEEEHGRFKQDNTQLREKNKSLTDDVAKLEKELSNAMTLAGNKYKKQLEEVQAKCDEIVKEKKQLEDRIKQATEAVDLMDVPVKKLTRLLASRFPEDSGKGTKNGGELNPPTGSSNNPNKFGSRLSKVNLGLLLCLLALCGYGCYTISKLPERVAVVLNTEKGTDKNDHSELAGGIAEPVESENEIVETDKDASASEGQTPYDDFGLCRIDIPEWNGSDKIVKEKTYTLEVKRDQNPANVPDGIWTATTSSHGIESELPGIIITGNHFEVDPKVTEPTNVRIFYTVNTQQKLTKLITVE